MSKAAFIRLQKDYAHLLAKPLPGVEVKVCECDLLKPWKITLEGPVYL